MAGETFEFFDDYVGGMGEGPVWSEAEQALYWIDSHEKKVLRLRVPGKTVEQRDLFYRPSCLALIEGGGLLIGYKKGIGRFDFDGGEATPLPLKGINFDVVSFNDGACDRAGNLWIGTRHMHASEPVCALYRIGPDMSVTPVVENLVLSNGIAWSPDERTMYHVDSRHLGNPDSGCVYAYDFDVETSTLSNQRILLDYCGKGRRPDGCTVDAEGYLWVAEIMGSRIARYAPDGTLDREVMLPFSRTASLAFGGDDMSTLFVTSIRHTLSEKELVNEPTAGVLMAFNPGVKGKLDNVFRGPI